MIKFPKTVAPGTFMESSNYLISDYCDKSEVNQEKGLPGLITRNKNSFMNTLSSFYEYAKCMHKFNEREYIKNLKLNRDHKSLAPINQSKS